MKLEFTLKLISFIYNETSAEENSQILDRIQTDAKSNDMYSEFMEAKEILNSENLKPSRKSRQRILEYSEKTGIKTA
ncbi:hypothetical protein [Membranihabitans maritimus]|uniref:hypothetical protein n=1 Tax=Membranihabitans maritimus TaxID=2904244 RepID=UPI001F40E1DE|nr:hypothetical protein [Membranihabitans maritimus]